MRLWRRCLLVLGQAMLLVAIVSCTGDADGSAPAPSVAAPAPPWPARPVVDLTYHVPPDLQSVAGQEHVVFTPDLSVCELVFRAWPNKPTTAAAGNALVLGNVSVDGVATTPNVSAAGAPFGAPGTLVEVPLPECVEAGREIRADLEFRVTLGRDTDERMGFAPTKDVAWFGSAFPMLAWERDRGWAEDPAVDVYGEMATSEDFHLRSLRVIAPTQYHVMGTGSAVDSGLGDETGTTAHEFTAPAVRDVTVSVGRLQVLEREIDGVRVHLAAAATGSQAPLDTWADQIGDSMRRLVGLLGRFPYPDLWVTVLPNQVDGVEFPGALQFGAVSRSEQRWLVTHELAHMWFYGLVGNNQARDPWLDESFASFAQVVTAGDSENDSSDVPARLRDEVGQPMTYWADFRRADFAYTQGVYVAGAEALVEARRQAGAEAFDAAMRNYIQHNAHRIATPADVERAFARLPEALAVLREAGALPASGS
jgi:Peptidase family M1 domain